MQHRTPISGHNELSAQPNLFQKIISGGHPVSRMPIMSCFIRGNGGGAGRHSQSVCRCSLSVRRVVQLELIA